METKRKTTTSSAVKNRHKVKTYKDYRIPVRKDSELFEKIEQFKEGGGEVSVLIKSLLEEYFEEN